jgi:L-iditol 2-dehydrogenase
MTETVTAVWVHDDPRRLSVEEFTLPDPGPREVLVETRSVGICHSDMELLEGHLDGWMDISYPVVFGHEWSGEVLSVGPEVDVIAAGDRVTGCTALGNNRWFGLTAHGAAAERFVVSVDLLHVLPDSMSWEQGALCEPFACVYQGFQAIGGADPSHSVFIVGGGTIGQFALSAAHACGAHTVMVELSGERRKLARRLGANAVLDPTSVDDLGEAAAELTEGRGADLVIEAAGAGKALASTFELAGRNGRILFLGLCAEPLIPAPIRLIEEKDLTIRGSTGAPPEIWQPTLRFLDRSRLDLSPVVTSRFDLEAADQAFDAARDLERNIKVHLQAA